MIVKAFVATALVAAPLVASDDIAFIQYPQVRQVDCGNARGTAFQTTKGWVSVAHVTMERTCLIDGQPLSTTEENKDSDFSRLVVQSRRHVPLMISCKGFIAGQTYWSTGYAYGREYQQNVRLIATGLKGWGNFDVLVGDHTVIPGMSGGPIFNSNGEVVGTVNAFNGAYGLSFSRSLKETSLCHDSASAAP